MKYTEPPLPDGNYVTELRRAEEQAAKMDLEPGDTIEIDLRIDDDFPEAVKEQIREMARRRIEKITGAKVTGRQTVKVKTDLTERLQQAERRLAEVEKQDPAIAGRLDRAEKRLAELEGKLSVN